MKTLLIIEDDDTYRGMIKETLGAAFPYLGIKEAGDGREAIQEIDNCVPEIVVMDIRLPGANGIVLTKRILREHPSVDIAILTNYDLPEYRESAFQSGAKSFLLKQSVLPGDIISVVKGFLAQKGISNGLREQ